MGIPYVVSVLEVGKVHSTSVPADSKQALSVLLLLLLRIRPTVGMKFLGSFALLGKGAC